MVQALLRDFVGLLTIVDPIGVIPFYIPLLRDIPEASRRGVPFTASVATFVLLAGSYAVGHPILTFFGVSLPAIQVVGGALIMHLSWSLLAGTHSATKGTSEEAAEHGGRHLAWVPLATPLLAGPGSISYAILMGASHDTPVRWALTLIPILGVALVTWVVLILAHPIERRLGVTGTKILERLFGLLLAALGLQVVMAGLGAVLPTITVTIGATP